MPVVPFTQRPEEPAIPEWAKPSDTHLAMAASEVIERFPLLKYLDDNRMSESPSTPGEKYYELKGIERRIEQEQGFSDEDAFKRQREQEPTPWEGPATRAGYKRRPEDAEVKVYPPGSKTPSIQWMDIGGKFRAKGEAPEHRDMTDKEFEKAFTLDYSRRTQDKGFVYEPKDAKGIHKHVEEIGEGFFRQNQPGMKEFLEKYGEEYDILRTPQEGNDQRGYYIRKRLMY